MVVPKRTSDVSTDSGARISGASSRSCSVRRPTACRSGRFSVVKAAIHLKERAKYAVKVVENRSLGDVENLEALETEVRDDRAAPLPFARAAARRAGA